MARFGSLALILLTLCRLASAQQPEVVFPRGVPTGDMALFTTVEIDRPTMIILLPVTLNDTSSQQFRLYQWVADSIFTSLKPVAIRHGYVLLKRAARWAAIHDRAFNAHYAAASNLMGMGFVIITPGLAPRLLRYWPLPGELEQELADYEQLFRHLPS